MRKFQFMIAALTICGASMITSCSNDDDAVNPPSPDEVEAQLQKMTLREKVGQLFYVPLTKVQTTSRKSSYRP